MNSENYIASFGKMHPLSAGLSAYINAIALRTNYKKGETLVLQKEAHLYFPLLEDGQASLFAVEKASNKTFEIGTFHSGEFLLHYDKEKASHPHEVNVIFLEDSSIIGISEKHHSNIMRLFPDAYLLNQRFSFMQFDRILSLFFNPLTQ